MNKSPAEPSQHHALYIVRHAQSAYNFAQLKSMHNEDIHTEIDNLDVRFSHDMIDCPISQIGYKQAFDASQKLKDINVKIVLTSPLRRCLQTTHEIFKDHKNKPKVFVWPTLKEMLLSAGDVSDDLETIKKEFPDWDFSAVDQLANPGLWLFYMLNKDKSVNEALVEELFKEVPNKADACKRAKTFIVDKLRKIYPEMLENQPDINNRAIEVKKVLKEKLKELGAGETLVMVTHSRFLEAFTALSFEEDGAPLHAKWMVNCEVTPFSLEEGLVANSL